MKHFLKSILKNYFLKAGYETIFFKHNQLLHPDPFLALKTKLLEKKESLRINSVVKPP